MDGVPNPTAAVFLEGAAQAIMLVNIQLAREGQAPLFCAHSLSLDAGALYDLADHKLTGPHEPMLFIIAALDALRERYPC